MTSKIFIASALNLLAEARENVACVTDGLPPTNEDRQSLFVSLEQLDEAKKNLEALAQWEAEAHPVNAFTIGKVGGVRHTIRDSELVNWGVRVAGMFPHLMEPDNHGNNILTLPRPLMLERLANLWAVQKFERDFYIERLHCETT